METCACFSRRPTRRPVCPQHQALGFSPLWLGSPGFVPCWLCPWPRWLSASVVLHRAAGLTGDLSGWSGGVCSWVLRVRWVHNVRGQGGLSRGSLPATLLGGPASPARCPGRRLPDGDIGDLQRIHRLWYIPTAGYLSFGTKRREIKTWKAAEETYVHIAV